MNPLKALTNYLRSVKSELEKVSWPSRRDTIRYSALVIGISVVTAVIFASLDAGFSKLFEYGVTERTKIAAEAAQKSAQQAASSTQQAAPTSTSQPTIDFNDVTPITTPASSTK